MNNYTRWIKIPAFCALIFFFPSFIFSQDCPNFDIELLSQDDVDNFSVNYPNCTELKRDLCIGKCSGSPLPYSEITSLVGLNQIEKIEGNLEIKFTTGLTDLSGLEGLIRVNHNVWLKTNESLISLSGLENLKYIGCDLKLEYLPINSIDGLMGIDSLLGSIEIVANNNLTNLDGIANATQLGNGIKITNNESIQSIQGLSNFQSIENSIHVVDCPNLTSLIGLHNIETIGNQLEIAENHSLVNLEGLEGLTTVTTSVYLSSNNNLLNLTGLGKLESTDRLTIANHEALNSLEGLGELETANVTLISNNSGLLTLDGLNKLTHANSLNLSTNSFTSISGLSNLRTVGTLSLTESRLADLSEFQQLDSIGTLRLTDNSQLQNLSGLKETISINYLQIRENELLSNIQGLVLDSLNTLEISRNQNILSLEGANIRTVSILKIQENPTLVGLYGLQEIEKIHAIRIGDNPILENLEYVHIEDDGELIIDSNSGLVDLSGLDSVSSLRALRIRNNQTLLNFDGIENLKKIGFFEIQENPNLSNINGLRNIVPEEYLEFWIYNNPLLSNCNLAFICESLQQIGQTYIWDNGPGCNAPDDIDCGNYISGNVIYDYNSNGSIDSEDIFVEGVQVYLETRDQINYSTADGSYTYFIDDGEEVIISFIDTPLWTVVSEPDTYQFQYDAQQTSCCGYDFLLDYKNKNHNAVVDLVLPNLRCNSEVQLQVHYTLIGGLSGEGKVVLSLDPLSQFISSDPMPTAQIGNTLEWEFPATLPFQKQLINVNIATPNESFVGEELSFESEVYITQIGDEAVSASDFSGIVLCSYDPNDKQVHPYSESSYTNFDDSTLIYTIRFQNTGNAEAVDVVLKDTLSEFLDPNSLRIMSSSHSSILEVSRNNPNFITFDFPYIYLIDSMTNPILSQGYVQYSVEIKNGLSPGTVIENKAHIYFDNNPSIITNTTLNEFYFDIDQDGYLSIEDCNDEDHTINPLATEVPYNGVDEDCNDATPDDDLDQDGYDLTEDCNDQDATISPQAEEILDNDIDENCDGIVGISTNTEEWIENRVLLHPVPAIDFLSIQEDIGDVDRIRMYSIAGNLVLDEKIEKRIRIDHIAEGVYIAILIDKNGELVSQQKIVVWR